ncbi:unnamed protein product [Caenorhabditis angaria]|uniref:Uncharacterized protein n=1 Tax=Caenorhabditis angaria TaxID=860376 RepID=A0A9P1MYS6_9PELO|nr:unnamed protein product [Caenorhabditis angaria]
MPEVPRKTMSFEEEDFYIESTEELFEIDEEEIFFRFLLDSLLDKAFDGKKDEDSAIDTMKDKEEDAVLMFSEEVQGLSAEEEEKLVDLDLIPNFSTNRNVYGTSFNV